MQGGPPGERLLFLRLRQMPRLDRFLNSQKSEADFLNSMFLNSGRVLYPVIYVANPVRGHKEVPRSTGHIMVTTRYSDQQGSKSRQKCMRLCKRWHRPITKRFIKPSLLYIESSLDRLGLLSPTHDQRSQQQIGQIRSNQF